MKESLLDWVDLKETSQRLLLAYVYLATFKGMVFFPNPSYFPTWTMG